MWPTWPMTRWPIESFDLWSMSHLCSYQSETCFLSHAFPRRAEPIFQQINFRRSRSSEFVTFLGARLWRRCLQSHLSIPGADAVDGSVISVSRRAATCGVLQHMFDFSLLRSPTFIVICLSGVLPTTGQWSLVSDSTSLVICWLLIDDWVLQFSNFLLCFVTDM